MSNEKKVNRLIHEPSPYLQQHAHNPVDWFPWNEEALKKAKEENKPILLSIGYAACHWCHVMAHESFEDDETACLMNKFFVNIKVDREERPDLDKTYQMAHYVLTRQGGGWPLTVFLTPDDLVPFFSGTYFPREAQYNLPGFKTLLTTIADIYEHQPEQIKQQNIALSNLLQQTREPTDTVVLTPSPIKDAYDQLEKNFDQQYGGFGTAPKFPQPARLEFILQYLPASPMLSMTLNAMANGGIYDQLGGGFFRYAVDANWQIPHFEKMLYDNGQLLHLYARTTAYAKNTDFKALCEQLCRWVIEEMQPAEGGYFSSIDADSEGKEGKFYIWDKNEIRTLLSQEEYDIVELYYGLNQPPNFESHWHLHVIMSLETIANQLSLPLSQVKNTLQVAQAKLLNARSKRAHPHVDKKILAGWNGLMVKGLYAASIVLNNTNIQSSAEKALERIKATLWDGKQLYVSYKDGKTSHAGFLDDYVFLIDALLMANQIEWNSEHLNFAIQLANLLLEKFEDDELGGFFFTEKNDELLYRPKTFMDEALPSGNGVAAHVLLLLAALTGENKFFAAAERTLKAAWKHLSRFPAEHCTLVLALQEFLYPPQVVIIRGENLQEMREWQHKARKHTNFVFAIPNTAKHLPIILSTMPAKATTCAYICEGFQCTGAIENLKDLIY